MGIWKPSKKVMSELEHRGVRTRATVVRIARGGSTSGHADGTGRIDDPLATSRMRTTVRITTPSGETFETRARLTFRLAGIPKVGATVPVVYDPDDHDVVEVDDVAHLAEVQGGPATAVAHDIVDVRLGQVGGVAGSGTAAGDPGSLGFDPADLASGLAHGEQVVADHLEQMRTLHEQGVLSDAQFEMIRRQMPGQS